MSDSAAEQLHDQWISSRSAWPGIEVAADDFSAYVRARVPEITSDGRMPERLCVADLYLTCACALRVAGAIETFERVFLVHVPRFLARLDGSATTAEEVKQMLRERLFVGGAEHAPRIATYQGRGSLMAWLRTVAVHTAINLHQSENARAEVQLDESGLAQGLVGEDLDLELIKARYREEFHNAVGEALRGLPSGERTLLRLHLVGGLSTTKLGTMFHVDQSTIVRRLAAVRDTVREVTHALLRERLGVSGDELDSLAGLLLSRLDLSLTDCLRSLA